MEISVLEKEHVYDIYQEISKCFDDSRVRVWDCVQTFFNHLSPNSYICDAGCGNGKNIRVNANILSKKNFIFDGFDFSEKLLSIARTKTLQYFKDINYGFEADFFNANILDIPKKEKTYDAVISIAVIHHLDCHEKRIHAINECMRILKTNCCLLFSMWAFEQNNENFKFKNGNNLVPWKIRAKDIIPDVKKDEKNKIIKVVDRFYFISDEEYIDKLLKDINQNYYLVSKYNEKGNWIIILKKV